MGSSAHAPSEAAIADAIAQCQRIDAAFPQGAPSSGWLVRPNDVRLAPGWRSFECPGGTRMTAGFSRPSRKRRGPGAAQLALAALLLPIAATDHAIARGGGERAVEAI